MATRVNENAGPGQSTWSPRGDTGVEYAYPRGRIGRFFAKFFATFYCNQSDSICELRSSS